MIDYPEWEQATPLMLVWVLLLYLYVLKDNWKQVVVPLEQLGGYTFRESRKIFFLLIIFALTCFCNGDFFHSIVPVHYMDSKWMVTPNFHYEIVYQYIAKFTDGNYLLWRLIVWGGAILLITLTAKRIGCSIKQTLFIVFALYAVQYSYARSTLAQSIYFYGLSFLIAPNLRKGRISNIVLALVIISIAPFFHRSAYLLLASTPIVFLPNISNKKSMFYIFLYVSFIAIATVLMSKVIFDLDLLSITDDERLVTKFENYTDAEDDENREGGIAKRLIIWLTNLSIFVILYKIVTSLVRNGVENMNQNDGYLKISFCIIAASLTLNFCGPEFYVISYRYGIMSFIPFSITISNLYKQRVFNFKDFKLIIFVGIVPLAYRLLYSTYLSIIK